MRIPLIGSFDGWIEAGDADAIERLAAKFVKHLGRESFFDLM